MGKTAEMTVNVRMKTAITWTEAVPAIQATLERCATSVVSRERSETRARKIARVSTEPHAATWAEVVFARPVTKAIRAKRSAPTERMASIAYTIARA